MPADPMRILVVSQYFWPETFRINEIVAGLTARGHQVTVLTGKPNYPGGDLYPEYVAAPQRFATYEGAEIVRVPLVPRGSSRWRLAANYASFVASGLLEGARRLRRREFDVILVCQLSPITSAIPALLLRRLKRAPTAMWILDLWPETLSAVGALRHPRALRAASALSAFVYRGTDLVLVQSRAFVDSVVRHGKQPEAIRYFPAWAEATFEHGLDGVTAAPELAPHAGTTNIMFAGNIGEAQDFPAILAAADLLRSRDDIRWLVVGDGRAAPDVKAEIARRGLEARVVMLGRHGIERMPAFFAGASALLVSLKPDPVFAMTIPGKVQSYLSAGRPVIAMLDGEGARVVTEAGAGFVVPAGDAAGLAEAVRRFADLTEAERARLGAAGRAYCRREFDRTALLDRLEGWLTELARRGIPRA